MSEPEPIDPDDAQQPEHEAPGVNLFRAGVIVECALGIVAGVIGWWVGVAPTATIRWQSDALPDHARAAGWGLAAVLPMAIGVLLIDRYPVGPLREFNRMVAERVTPLFAGLTPPQIGLLSLTAGIGEEMLFRGVLQAGLAQWIEGPQSTLAALLGASLVFGLCHYVSTTYFLLTALIGVYLGALFLWTDNLLAPIVAHAVYDFLALMYLVRWKSSA